jgi:thiaminase/transcriptional activator TenA
MRLYAYLGHSLRKATAEDYLEWITTYADPAFEELAATLERLLDAYADDTEPVRETYRRAMRLEIAFFDAACHRA